MRAPPHLKEISVCILFMEYPTRANHGYCPNVAFLPPRILWEIDLPPQTLLFIKCQLGCRKTSGMATAVAEI